MKTSGIGAVASSAVVSAVASSAEVSAVSCSAVVSAVSCSAEVSAVSCSAEVSAVESWQVGRSCATADSALGTPTSVGDAPRRYSLQRAQRACVVVDRCNMGGSVQCCRARAPRAATAPRVLRRL